MKTLASCFAPRQFRRQPEVTRAAAAPPLASQLRRLSSEFHCSVLIEAIPLLPERGGHIYRASDPLVGLCLLQRRASLSTRAAQRDALAGRAVPKRATAASFQCRHCGGAKLASWRPVVQCWARRQALAVRFRWAERAGE